MLLSLKIFGQSEIKLNQATFKQNSGKWYKIEPNGQAFEVVENVLTIKLKGSANPETFAKRYNAVIIRKASTGFIDIRLSDNISTLSVAQTMEKDSQIEIVEVSVKGKYSLIPNDGQYNNQWYLNRIGMESVWDITLGRCIVIGVIDSGVDINHRDLGNGTDTYNNLWANAGEDAWTNPNNPASGNGVDNDGNGLIDDWRGFDFENNNNDVRSPTNSHGTRVAGIVGAKTNNSTDVAGMGGGNNSQGFRIMSLGVGEGAPQSHLLDDAILYAIARGARVIQMSLTVTSSTAIDAAILQAVNSGIPVVCASGNDNAGINYPASNGNVIAVGSTNHSDQRSSFSNFGPALFIAAPGEDIRSTENNNAVGDDDGTSFAAPQVSATIGLMLQLNPSLTIAEIRQILANTALKSGGYNYNWDPTLPGHSRELGFGRLNAYAAVDHALNIVGPNLICTGGTFSLEPGNLSVTWSSNLPTVLSINNNGQATAHGNGLVTISATFIDGCGTTRTESRTVNVGAPSFSNFLVNGQSTSNATICVNNFASIEALPVDPLGNYSWSISSSGNAYLTNYFSASTAFNAYTADCYGLTLQVSNACGTTQSNLTICAQDCFARYTISPNPAKDVLNVVFEPTDNNAALPDEITLVSEQALRTVRTVNVQELAQTASFRQNQKVSFEVTELPRGIYYIQVKNSRRKDKELDVIRILLE